MNPPYYVPLVEVVPAPWTDPEVPKKTRAIMEEIGQSPVNLSKEVPGFALNRIQLARFPFLTHFLDFPFPGTQF